MGKTATAGSKTHADSGYIYFNDHNGQDIDSLHEMPSKETDPGGGDV